MRVFLGAMMALALFGTPAAAAGAVEGSDPCGDNSARARVFEHEVASPDPITPAFDIKSVRLATAEGSADEAAGIDLVIRVCGQAAQPEAGQSYSWHWATPAGCTQRVWVDRAIGVESDGKPGRVHVGYAETCVAEEQPLPIGTEVDETFGVELDPSKRLTIAGDTVSVALRASDLPAVARHGLAEGATALAPYALARANYSPTSVFLAGETPVEVILANGQDRGSAPDFTVGD